MHAATDNVATAVIVVVVIVCVGIVSVIVAVGSEADPYKRTSVKSSTVEATARETSMKAATAEAPTTTKSTAMEAASAAHAASTSTAAATSVTAATTTAAATSECRGWLNQADRCHCEQGYNRFSHSAFPSLDEAPPKAHNTFAAGLFERSKSARSKLTVSIANLIVHHPERTQTKA
jgi:hypothetical protein